jgi:hypothetical protein
VQEERQVGNDNCVSFRRLKLQIAESPLRPSGNGLNSPLLPRERF